MSQNLYYLDEQERYDYHQDQLVEFSPEPDEDPILDDIRYQVDRLMDAVYVSGNVDIIEDALDELSAYTGIPHKKLSPKINSKDQGLPPFNYFEDFLDVTKRYADELRS